MDLLLTFLTSPVIGSSIGLGLAVAILLGIALAYVYGGLYYSLPRLVLKWLSRRALAA